MMPPHGSPFRGRKVPLARGREIEKEVGGPRETASRRLDGIPQSAKNGGRPGLRVELVQLPEQGSRWLRALTQLLEAGMEVTDRT